MASENPRKRLREEVTCPVCLEYFTNPVTLACEHSFCHACILYSPTSALCPVCKRDFHPENMNLNYSLASFVEISKLLNDQEEAGEHDTCGRHQEPLKFFCRDDEVPICTSCKEEHQSHDVIPVEEAAQEYEDRISTSLEALKKCKEEMTSTISASQAESDDLLKQMETERQKMVVKFKDLWPFLKNQKYRTLARMEGIEEQMQIEKDHYMDRLLQPVSPLSKLIQEVDRMTEVPASQLLQDFDLILERSHQKVESNDPGDFPLVLKQKVSVFTDNRPSLVRAIKKFKVYIQTNKSKEYIRATSSRPLCQRVALVSSLSHTVASCY